MDNALYIGLMSGTSTDAIDAALVNFATPAAKLIATYAQPIPTTLQQRIHQLIQTEGSIDQVCQLDHRTGSCIC